jgi:hypothetical protein
LRAEVGIDELIGAGIDGELLGIGEYRSVNCALKTPARNRSLMSTPVARGEPIRFAARFHRSCEAVNFPVCCIGIRRDRCRQLASGLVMPDQPEGKEKAKNNNDNDIHRIHQYALAGAP